MKQFKHLLLLTLLSLCSVTSQAYKVSVNMIRYETATGDTTAYVYGYTSGITEAKIRSSITYNGKQIPVTSIGYDAFNGCTSLTRVTIPNSVTSIGYRAFEGCSSLTSVTIGNSVTSIGYKVFSGCSGLTSVTIPNSVTYIKESAFYGCSKLTSVTIPTSVTSIGPEAFSGCRGLTRVTIPNSVVSIGDGAFSGCSGLTSVIIPNSVTHLGESAFYKCSSLTSVEYNAVDCMGSASDFLWFNGCPLTSLKIGNEVKSIPSNLAYGQSKLTRVTIPNSVTSIGHCAFEGCSSLTSVTIPNSVTSIGDDAFHGCSRLTRVTIPNSVTSIGYSAFSGCYGLTSVEYNVVDCKGPSSSSYAFFKGCPLTSLKIGNEVKSIPSYLAYDRSKLTSVTIPNSVTSIGKSAFSGCGLESIYVKSKQPIALENDIVDGNTYNNAILYVPKGCVDIYKQYMFWDEFSTILEFNDDITGDADGNGVVDISDVNVLINVILAEDEASKYDGRADVTGDGIVDISDVNEIINIILGNN